MNFTRVCWFFALTIVMAALQASLEAEHSFGISGKFNAVFLNPVGSEKPAKIVVHWTGRPSARLSVWIDLDNDGAWLDREQLIEDALLSNPMRVFDARLPGEQKLQQGLRARYLLTFGNGEVQEIVERIYGIEPPTPGTRPRSKIVIEKSGGCAWTPGFHVRGMSDSVLASAVFDDGTGPALYVGGSFASVDDAAVSFIAKWDGTSWNPVGEGVNGPVSALVVHDDGSGSALIVGGNFTRAGDTQTGGIARWDGSVWTALGSGIDGRVGALAVDSDGESSTLYVGGTLPTAGGINVSNIAKWDGVTWSALGTGTDNTVLALTMYDAGSGPGLYAGGYFTTAGGVAVNRIAKWDGSTWTALGGGLGNTHEIRALTVFDHGDGPKLIAGGRYNLTGPLSEWDGSTWKSLGAGLDGEVRSLSVHDDGSGPGLYIGGEFTSAGGIAANHIVRWDGSAWMPLGAGLNNSVETMTSHNVGADSALFIGGEFTTAGNLTANRIAGWESSAWSVPTSLAEEGNGIRGFVRALAVHDDGSGPALFVGGNFEAAGEVQASNIAKWDGSVWTPLGDGVNGEVLALASHDDGSGPALFVGGFFDAAGGITTDGGIAKWDGAIWSTLAGGTNGGVLDLATYDDGGGLALYVGGGFTTAGEVTVQNIAKWDGTNWSSLGGVGPDGFVFSMAAHDDGSGPALYIGGMFTAVAGVDASIARWSGSEWSSVWSTGFPGTGVEVWSLVVHDDGSGPALFASGIPSETNVSRWDGTSWTDVGSDSAFESHARASIDDGKEPGLFAVESNAPTFNLPRRAILKWDGSDWISVGMEVVGERIWVLEPFGRSVYVGGRFDRTGNIASANIAEYFCDPAPRLVLPPLTEAISGTVVSLPVRLETYSAPIASTTFSIDYDESCLDPDIDKDGILDNITVHVSRFDVLTQFDPADTNGEIDISVFSLDDPPGLLPSGNLVTIDYQTICTASSEISVDASIAFSAVPEPTFGDDRGQDVLGSWIDGIVRIWSGLRGDCNSSGSLGAADLTSIALELFDEDGDFWTDAPGSTFVGSPVGCDANASTRISAADATCTNELIFGRDCDPPLLETSGLAISTRLGEEIVWIGIENPSKGQTVGAVAFALDLDPDHFDFGSIDLDTDGIPDQVIYPQGTPSFSYVSWDPTDLDSELDIFLAAGSGLPLPEGTILEIGIPMSHLPIDGLYLSGAPSPSMGSPTGADLKGTIAFTPLFADGFETGDSSRWSSYSP